MPAPGPLPFPVSGAASPMAALRRPGIARPALLVVVLAVAGGAWNWWLGTAMPAVRTAAAAGVPGVAPAANEIGRWAPVVSSGLQGACLGAISVLLAGVLLRARTGRARAAAAVTMTVGAVAAEPLVFLGQWLPAGLFDDMTRRVDAALSSTALRYVQSSTGHIEGAALAAGVAFPAAILAIKGLFWVTKRDTREEVWQLALLGIPILATVRIAQALVAPLPGGGMGLALDAVDWTATGTASACAAGFAWWALALSMPREPKPEAAAMAPVPAPPPPERVPPAAPPA